MADVLGYVGDKRAVEPLIEALQYENILSKYSIAEALKKMTGQDLGQNYNRWKVWHEKRSP